MPVATTSHPLAETARRICESRGGKWSGSKGMACCPAHDDRTPSLGVSLAREGVPASALFSGGAIEPKMDTGLAAKPSAAALCIWRDAHGPRRVTRRILKCSRGRGRKRFPPFFHARLRWRRCEKWSGTVDALCPAQLALRS